MANVRIEDLPAATSADITLGTLFEIQSGSSSKKMTIQQLLVFLGIPVDVLASLTDSGDNQLAFASDARKPGEGAGNGTGSLVMTVNQSGWDIVADNSSATT